MIAMAWAALSLLFALAILLPLAILTEAEIAFRLTNVEFRGWAKNLPSEPYAKPPHTAAVVVDEIHASNYEKWTIEEDEGGLSTIRNVATQFWLTVRDGEVVGYSEPNAEGSKWSIETDAKTYYSIIKRPNTNLVMTAYRKEPSDPVMISVQPDDGSYAQQWAFIRVL